MTEYYELSDLDATIHTYKSKAGFIRGIKARMKGCHVTVRYVWQSRTWFAQCYKVPTDRTPGWQGVVKGRVQGTDCRWMYQNRGAFDWDCARG